MFHRIILNGKYENKLTKAKLCLLYICRLWWEWKGEFPKKDVVDYMEKNYPADWTYADFASQFRAELFGKCVIIFPQSETNLFFYLRP